MKQEAIYPGSFDPLHNGHLDIITRAAKLYDHLRVAVLHNPLKQHLFSIDERLKIIQAAVEGTHVTVEAFEGLLVDYVKAKGTKLIVKSLRDAVDLSYEMQMAQLNRHMYPELETTFLLSEPKWFYVSSTRIRELAHYGADISKLVPEASLRALKGKIPQAKEHGAE